MRIYVVRGCRQYHLDWLVEVVIKIGGVVVRDIHYPPPDDFPGQTSDYGVVWFDSTHFQDATNVVVRIEVYDGLGAMDFKERVTPIYNKGYVLANQTLAPNSYNVQERWELR